MGRREEKKDATRAAILKTSLRLFQSKGFRATTMRDIAAEAGIALGTTYNYFPTKEHLALRFFEESQARLIRRYHEEVEPEMPLEERIFLLISIQLESLRPYTAFLHAVVPQAAAPGSRLSPFSEDIGTLKARFLDFVAEIVADARECGELPDMPGYDGMLLQAFWVYHLGILLFWLNDASEGSAETYALLDRSLRFLIGALREGSAMEVISMARTADLDLGLAGDV